MTKLVRRYPVTAFFVLASAITWFVWVPRALVSEGYLDSERPVALGDFWTYAPAVAAVLAAALWGGRAGLRELGSRLIRWRIGLRWYVLVLVGPAAFWALVLCIFAAVGWSAAGRCDAAAFEQLVSAHRREPHGRIAVGRWP